MEGSPVREQRKLPIAQLNAAPDLQTFQTDVVRLVGSGVRHAEVFFGISDADAKHLGLPAWVKSHLDRHPALHKRLQQGEMVGISTAEDNAALRPAAAVRSSVVLIPVMSDGRWIASIGVVSPMDGPQVSAEDVEAVRLFSYDAGPILARLQEIQVLRRENQTLSTQVEEARLANETLDSLIEEKNGLQAILQMHSHQQVNVAHELRTPLAAIRGYVRMILDGRGGEINETQREYLRIVTDNTNRLISLVGWMSYVADRSAQHLKLSTFDFRDIWTECTNVIRPTLTEKSLKLTERLAEASFLMTGDREKLAQALKELTAVAVNVTENGGSLTAELTQGRDKELIFKLSARGASIPADTLSRIFDRPFNSATKPAQSTEPNTVSLSGVYDIVGMHGGRVFVNSTAGQGATFLFTLPAITDAGEENCHEQTINTGRRRR
jgi:signal transduction histidine kinase